MAITLPCQGKDTSSILVTRSKIFFNTLPMMNSQFFSSVAFGWYLHWFFGTLLLIGIVLLVFWMVKNLNKKDMLSWIIILLIIGILGTVLTMNTSLKAWKSMMNDDVDFEEMMELK